MHNLKKCNGTYKGLIGEFMFKLTRKWAVLTKCWKLEKYLMTFGKYYTPKQLQFIKEYWHSLDCLEICYVKGKKEKRLYEIKTKNEYSREIRFKPKITESSVNLYEEASHIGFSVYFAEVLWKDENI